MANGTTKPIKDVQVGDKVQATDPTSQTTNGEPVTQLHLNRDTDLADVTVTDSKGQQAVLHTTQNHPFWDATTQQWTPAAQLQAGDILRTPHGDSARVAVVRSFAGLHDMYNLTVDHIHTYYVVAGDTPVLVHNTGCGPTYENPGHHDPMGGPNPYNPGRAVLVPDAEGQFANSVEVNGVRWAKIGAGRKAVYYRYFNTGNDTWHWSGSTVGVTKSGASSAIPLDQVPISVRRR
jgi:hypothetical protein